MKRRLHCRANISWTAKRWPRAFPAAVAGLACPGHIGSSCRAVYDLSAAVPRPRPSELPAWVVVSAAGLGGLGIME